MMHMNSSVICRTNLNTHLVINLAIIWTFLSLVDMQACLFFQKCSIKGEALYLVFPIIVIVLFAMFIL